MAIKFKLQRRYAPHTWANPRKRTQRDIINDALVGQNLTLTEESVIRTIGSVELGANLLVTARALGLPNRNVLFAIAATGCSKLGVDTQNQSIYDMSRMAMNLLIAEDHRIAAALSEPDKQAAILNLSNTERDILIYYAENNDPKQIARILDWDTGAVDKVLGTLRDSLCSDDLGFFRVARYLLTHDQLAPISDLATQNAATPQPPL